MTFKPTSEQQDIIDYSPVHLRVAAGAGTGKTTTIVERLAQFVRSGIPPTRALGVTFTVKASDELRTRLRDRVGSSGTGEEVEVSTYHGFAASILDEFGSLVGYESSTMLLDDGHRSELGQLVLRDLDTTLDLTSMKQRVDDVLELNDALDRHLRNPSDVVAIAPSGSSINPDGPWPTRLELTRAVSAFREEKERLGLVEFADFIRKAVDLVRDVPEVAQQLADRYDIVLLDEYQDTDPAQRILLTTIFGPAAAVTAVGDTDQTIYEWRGASLDNFEAFPDHFPRSDGQPTETMPLSLNRRSDRLILDLANEIRSELPSIDGSKPLEPRADAGMGSVMASWFASEREEAWWLAADILRRHRDGTRWADIAILVRKRAWIPLLVAALRDHDIPTSVSDPGTLLQIPEVADVLAWLRIVSDPDAEPALLRILMGGQYRLGITDLNLLRLHAKRLDATTLLGAVYDGSHADLSESTEAAVTRFARIHSQLMQFAQVNSVANTINEIIARIGFWDEAAALRAGEATTARLNIARFLNIAHGWRPIEGRPTVRRFLRYIDALNESGRDEALTPPVRSVSDAVELTTVHGAKGLEWDVVYLPGLQHGDFPMGSRKHDDPDKHATLLPYELRLDSESLLDVATAAGAARREVLIERNRLSEYRLAYVAVTRARHHVSLSGHAWQDSVTKPKTESEILLTARDLPGATLGPWCEDPGPKPALMTFIDETRPSDPLFPDGAAAALRATIDDAGWVTRHRPDLSAAISERVDQLALEIGDLSEPHSDQAARPFATAVTNLVALAECPLKFKWIHYDKMPRRPSKAANDGTEFHRKVELHNLGKIALDDATPDLYDAVVEDAEEFEPNQGGEAQAPPWSVFEASRFANTQSRFSEVPFEVALGPGSVRGKIDAIYENEPGHWEIVDYKSGRKSDNPARLVQLQAYAVAAADGAVSIDRPDSMVVSFAYFGGGELVEVSETVDDAWLDEARSDVERLVTLGAEGPWDPTPSTACKHCDFRIHCKAGSEWVANNSKKD